MIRSLCPEASVSGYSGKENSVMEKRLSSFMLILVFLTGLSLLLYPTVSDYWNSMHQSRAIAAYTEEVTQLDQERYDSLWQQARAYNSRLLEGNGAFHPTVEQYEEQLNVSGTGVMGYVEIPRINCSLPVYHGTDEAVLQIAVGHLEWSSLPVGGEGTHCVISGHRGLPSAKLFTDLDQMEIGDTFLLRVLDEVLTYEVDQIRVVKPDELTGLTAERGEDYCTLVTCTPYGVNSHRLLVRGRRVENQTVPWTVRVTADAMQIEPVLAAPLVAAPMLLILLVWVMVRGHRKTMITAIHLYEEGTQ